MGSGTRLSAGHRFASPEDVMRHALELAARGLGHVEPNPPVGAVIVDDSLTLIGEGYHERFGGPHAEINALRDAGERARGATLYVTLEPCCHVGKTGPCSRAAIEAGLKRVVVATGDPAPHVSGGGIAELRGTGIEVEVGLLEADAKRLAAPFFKLIQTALPYVHAKWAMTLDGKIASRTGESKWITNEASRRAAHTLRGRMDAICVGAGTVLADDPLLTARPPGPRIATRVVVGTRGDLSHESQLFKTVREAPTIMTVCDGAVSEKHQTLRDAGIEVLPLPLDRLNRIDLVALLRELACRQMTNVLFEGGSELLGSLLDRDLIDEVHAFIAPKLLGGERAVSALGGNGRLKMDGLPRIERPEIKILDGDVYIHGPLAR